MKLSVKISSVFICVALLTISMCLGRGRKPENPEETHVNLLTDNNPSLGSKRGRWCCEVTKLPPVAPTTQNLATKQLYRNLAVDFDPERTRQSAVVRKTPSNNKKRCVQNLAAKRPEQPSNLLLLGITWLENLLRTLFRNRTDDRSKRPLLRQGVLFG